MSRYLLGIFFNVVVILVPSCGGHFRWRSFQNEVGGPFLISQIKHTREEIAYLVEVVYVTEISNTPGKLKRFLAILLNVDWGLGDWNWVGHIWRSLQLWGWEILSLTACYGLVDIYSTLISSFYYMCYRLRTDLIIEYLMQELSEIWKMTDILAEHICPGAWGYMGIMEDPGENVMSLFTFLGSVVETGSTGWLKSVSSWMSCSVSYGV